MMKFMIGSKNLHRVIMLVDFKVGIMASDNLLIDLLTDIHQPFIVVLTKADKIKNIDEIDSRIEMISKEIQSKGSIASSVVHCVSAQGSGYGLFELMCNLSYHLDQELVKIA